MMDESYGKYCNASWNVTKLKNMIAVVEKEMDRLHNQDYQFGLLPLKPLFPFNIQIYGFATIHSDHYRGIKYFVLLFFTLMAITHCHLP